MEVNGLIEGQGQQGNVGEEEQNNIEKRMRYGESATLREQGE